MAILTEFRISFARTINLGNFESARVEASVTLAVAEGDDLQAARTHAETELRVLIEETWRAQHKPKVAQSES